MVEDLPLITNAECNSIYGIVGDGVVCMDTEGGKGTCNGDSGGPLGHYDPVRERWVEFGIVSFGASAGCEVSLLSPGPDNSCSIPLQKSSRQMQAAIVPSVSTVTGRQV